MVVYQDRPGKINKLPEPTGPGSCTPVGWGVLPEYLVVSSGHCLNIIRRQKGAGLAPRQDGESCHNYTHVGWQKVGRPGLAPEERSTNNSGEIETLTKKAKQTKVNKLPNN